MSRYDPEAYWADLHREANLRSVGQSGLPIELNVHLYRIGRRNVLRFLERVGRLDPPPRRVFEAGAGTGYWVALWQELGAERVDGCDLAAAAAQRLSETFPGTFRAGDIAEPGVVPDDRSYDLVTALNVLLHIVDDERFLAATTNLSRAVAPGGALLLAEPVLVRSTERPVATSASSRARRLDRYRQAFAVHGLELEAIAASTVVGANPIERDDPRFGLYSSLWRRAARFARGGPRRADVAGRALSLADRLLIRSRAAPSGKLLLFRAPG